MKALQYEALIRAVFKCGRFGVAGADADIYRRLGEATCPIEGQVDQLKLGKSLGETAAHLENALEKVQKDYPDNKQFLEKIDKCLYLLCDPTKEKIDECIDKAWDAFRSVGLPK